MGAGGVWYDAGVELAAGSSGATPDFDAVFRAVDDMPVRQGEENAERYSTFRDGSETRGGAVRADKTPWLESISFKI